MLKNVSEAVSKVLEGDKDLQTLDSYEAEFWLTGSLSYKQWPGGFNDIDFFAQDTPEVRTWLSENGWSLLAKGQSEYDIDIDQVSDVFRKVRIPAEKKTINPGTKYKWDYVESAKNVEVALVKSLDKKKFMQKVLEAQDGIFKFSIANLPKEYRLSIYDYCWRVLDALMDD